MLQIKKSWSLIWKILVFVSRMTMWGIWNRILGWTPSVLAELYCVDPFGQTCVVQNLSNAASFQVPINSSFISHPTFRQYVDRLQNIQDRKGRNWNYPYNRPLSPAGLWEVTAGIFVKQANHRRRWGLQTYSTSRPPFTVWKILVVFSVGGWIDLKATVRLKGLSQLIGW
jgi:hypothetical protein